MSFVLHIIGPAFGGPSTLDGLYVASYDPDARDGHGAVTGTADRTQALHFETPADAFTFWRQPSTVRPLRPDGRPNKPLTAFHIEIMPSDKAPLFGTLGSFAPLPRCLGEPGECAFGG